MSKSIRAALLTAAIASLLAGCAATKLVTIPVKVAAKTVETAADVID